MIDERIISAFENYGMSELFDFDTQNDTIKGRGILIKCYGTDMQIRIGIYGVGEVIEVEYAGQDQFRLKSDYSVTIKPLQFLNEDAHLSVLPLEFFSMIGIESVTLQLNR